MKHLILMILAVIATTACREKGYELANPPLANTNSAPAVLAVNSSASADESDLELLAELEKRRIPIATSPDGILYSRVQLDPAGEALQSSSSHAASALAEAALSYSISTRDFAVTVEDLVVNGWWPFASPETDFPQASLHTLEGPGVQLEGYDSWRCTQVNSPRWILHAKSAILREFYHWHMNSAVNPSPLPAELPAFWINPATQAPMKESTDFGDYRKNPGADFVSSYQDQREILDTGIEVKVLNERTRPSSTGKSTSEDDECCIARRIYRQYSSGHSHSYSITCGCGGSTYTCNFQWHFNCTSRAWYWEITDRGVPCDSELYPDETVFGCGGSAPSTYINADCTATIDNQCPVPICVVWSDPCWQQWQDIADDLANVAFSTASYITLPGPVCDC